MGNVLVYVGLAVVALLAHLGFDLIDRHVIRITLRHTSPVEK